MRIKDIELQELCDMAEKKEYKNTKLNSVVAFMSNMGKKAKARLKQYANGRDVVVVYTYDDELHRFTLFEDVPIN